MKNEKQKISQKQTIFNYLRNLESYGVPTSSSRVQKFAFIREPLIGSVRRAVSELVKEGLVEYTNEKIKGPHESGEKLFKLAKK